MVKALLLVLMLAGTVWAVDRKENCNGEIYSWVNTCPNFPDWAKTRQYYCWRGNDLMIRYTWYPCAGGYRDEWAAATNNQRQRNMYWRATNFLP